MILGSAVSQYDTTERALEVVGSEAKRWYVAREARCAGVGVCGLTCRVDLNVDESTVVVTVGCDRERSNTAVCSLAEHGITPADRYEIVDGTLVGPLNPNT